MVKYTKVFWSIVIAVIFIDQISKQIVHAVQPQGALFRLTQNTGAGFGILQDQTIVLAIISLVVASAVIYYYEKIPKQKWPQILWALFLGGVIGNLIDRLLRGYVIDFIDVGFWPSFNIADSALTVSVMGLVIWYWKNDKKE
jgi:signal peptidase II